MNQVLIRKDEHFKDRDGRLWSLEFIKSEYEILLHTFKSGNFFFKDDEKFFMKGVVGFGVEIYLINADEIPEYLFSAKIYPKYMYISTDLLEFQNNYCFTSIHEYNVN